MDPNLACLPDYLPGRRLAADIGFTRAALSEACHHHAYGLAPTAPELERWLDAVGRLVAAVDGEAD
jgi:hypothetical protein